MVVQTVSPEIKSIYVVIRVEFEFDLGFCVAPQKPGKNREKLVFETKKNVERKNFGVEKSNVGNRLKRVFLNFQAEQNEVRGVNDRSKFPKKIEIREAFFPFI